MGGVLASRHPLALAIMFNRRSPKRVPVAAGVPISAGVASDSNIPIAQPVDVDVPPCTPGGRRIHVVNGAPHMARPAPPGAAPPGGRWVEAAFFGANSMLCCFAWLLMAPPLAFLVPCFPCDRMLVYVAPDGTVWGYDGYPVDL